MELLTLYLSALDEAHFKVVARSQSGQAEADSKLPFYESEKCWRTTLIKALEVDEVCPDLFQNPGELDWITSQGWLSGDRKSSHPNRLARIGLAIYEALFPVGNVRYVLQRMMDRAEIKGVQLHIQLEFAADITRRNRLPDYPWELASPDGKTFLAHHQVRFSRYIAYPAAVPQFSPIEKLNVLLVSSNASDVDKGLLPLSKREQKAVFKGLEAAQKDGHINVEGLPTGSLSSLRDYLSDPRKPIPHIFHFDGHGYFGKRCNSCRTIHKDLRTRNCEKCKTELPEPQGYLVFETEDDETEADYVSATELGTLLQSTSFGNAETQQGGVAVAVLSACKSGMALGSESVFNGVAQGLISHRIPSVVAMQYTVRADSATRFAEQFYRSLGRKNPLGIAVSQGQEAMGVTGNQWYRPVLYLRWQDAEGGQLFSQPQKRGSTATQNRDQDQPGSFQSGNSKLSRFQRLELERFKRELGERERDYQTVSQQLKVEGDGPRQNQLKDQLQMLGDEMGALEQQIRELEGGDEV